MKVLLLLVLLPFSLWANTYGDGFATLSGGNEDGLSFECTIPDHGGGCNTQTIIFKHSADGISKGYIQNLSDPDSNPVVLGYVDYLREVKIPVTHVNNLKMYRGPSERVEGTLYLQSGVNKLKVVLFDEYFNPQTEQYVHLSTENVEIPVKVDLRF